MMSNKLDEGKILYKKYFPYPKNLNHIEKDFDNKIRALTLVEYIGSKKLRNIKILGINFYRIILLIL